MKFEIAPKLTEIQANWDDARMYCFSLTIDGKIGWRLPTKEELNEIYESDNDFQKSYYWSSTEGDGRTAWLQDIYIMATSSATLSSTAATTLEPSDQPFNF